MSFYGSVYYQLIDTFHKIVLKNSGKNTVSFLETAKIPKDDIVQQAVGRKGVISFDAGNKWINFSEEQIDDPNSADANATIPCYKIWHGAPDTGPQLKGHGFKLVEVSTSELKKRTDDDGYIKLNDDDKIETYELVYDNAGHIAGSKKVLYRLPKAQVNEKVEILEKNVGVPPENLSVLPEVEKGKANLFGYVEVNTGDIRDLKKKVGEWQVKGYETYSIADAIGDINLLLDTDGNTGYLTPTEFRSLSDVIGKIKELNGIEFLGFKGVSGKPDNVISGIVKLKKATDEISTIIATNKELSEKQFEALGNRFGENINDDSVYDHLNRIYEHIGVICGSENINGQNIKTLTSDLELDHTLMTLANRVKDIEDDLDWSQNSVTVNAEIQELKNRATDLENTLNWSSTRKTVAEEIDDINNKLGWSNEKTVSAEVADLHEEDAEINKLISDHFEKAIEAQNSLNAEDKRIADAINIGLIPSGSTVMGEINKINTTIGTLPEEYSDVIDFISTVESNANDIIGELPEDATNIASLIESVQTDLQNQLDTVKEDLGTKGETDAFTAIGKNANDIATLNNKLGINEGQTVAGLIAGLDAAVIQDGKDIAKNGQDIAAIQKTVTDINTIIGDTSDWETTDSVVSKIADINTIIGDTSDWGESDNDIVTKLTSLEGKAQIIGDTAKIENTIIDLLLEIKNSIKDMKVVINNLHPNDDEPPFPEVIESSGTEGSENGSENGTGGEEDLT